VHMEEADIDIELGKLLHKSGWLVLWLSGVKMRPTYSIGWMALFALKAKWGELDETYTSQQSDWILSSVSNIHRLLARMPLSQIWIVFWLIKDGSHLPSALCKPNGQFLYKFCTHSHHSDSARYRSASFNF